MNTQVFYGVNLGWGLGQSTFAITNAVGVYQSVEHDLKCDENETRDQRGNVVTWTAYNPTETVMIEYYLSDASAASGSAAPGLNTNVPDRGSKVTITSVGPISGSGWIVQDSLIRETSTDNMKCTLKAIRFPAIS